MPRPRLSEPLRRQALFWVNRLSFGDVARLLLERAGAALLSEDGLWRLAQAEAQARDAQQQREVEETAALPEPGYVAPTDLYAAGAGEFVVLTDGIGVKAQRPTRTRQRPTRTRQRPTRTRAHGPGESQGSRSEKKPGERRHDTDVLILPRRGGGEQVLCEGVSGGWTLVEAARAFLRREWGGASLAVVAITNGAPAIRGDLAALFGGGVRVVLDWYHLAKRVYEHLSMAAHSRSEREAWEQRVLSLLWRGQASAARQWLAGVAPRNAGALAALIGYLDKHQPEIIDYGRRQQAGLPIGSGRMEKCVDQVVGRRQKGKGMSWTKSGSRALALLRVAELNALQPLPA